MATSSAPLPPDGRFAFPELSTKDLRKLRDDGSSIRALAVLWCLGAAICLLLALVAAGEPVWAFPPAVLAAAGLLQLATALACWRWTSLGRWMGVASCLLILPGLPLGTLIGAFGLVALARGGPLFGPQRVLIAAVRA